MGFAHDNTNISTNHLSRDDPCGAVGVSGAARGTSGFRKNYWTAIGRSDRIFCYCMETENIEDFEEHAVSGCSAGMHSEWVIATRHTSRNLAHAHISHS